jgi:hypothetical protein
MRNDYFLRMHLACDNKAAEHDTEQPFQHTPPDRQI